MTYTAEEVRAIASDLECDTGHEYPQIDKAMAEGRACCNAYADLLDRQAAGVTDEVVAAYVNAVNEHLGNMTEAEWQADRLDKRTHLARVARIGLTAALLAVWPVAAEPVAQPAERQGEVLIEAVGRVERDMTGELGINWLVEGGIDALEEGSVLLCSEHDYLTDDDGSATLYLHPTTPVGVPDGWQLVPKKLTPEMEDAADQRDDDEPLSDWGKVVSASRQAIWDAQLVAAPSVSHGVE